MERHEVVSRVYDASYQRLVVQLLGVCGDLAEAVGGNCSPATRCAPASPPRPRHRRDRYQRRRDRFRINLTKAAGL